MPPRRREQSRGDPDDPGPSGQGGGGGGGGGGAGAAAVQPVHRFAFVQHLMKNGCMTEDAAKEVVQRLTGSGSDDTYRRLLSDQNREMASLHLRIKTMKYPLDDERYVGLINTHADAASKFGTCYTVGEREFFRAVMEAIALDRHAPQGVGALSSLQLLNLEVRPAAASQQPDGAGPVTQAAAAAKLTKGQKEAVLRKLVADGWLRHGRANGHYSLGPRTFLELGPQLLELDDLPDDTRAAWQDLM